MDPHVDKLARVLVHYSVKLRKGQLVKISGEIAGLPLVKAVYKEAVEVGAHPYVQIRVPDNEEVLMKLGSDQQIQYIPAHSKFEIGKIDAYIGIWGSSNTRFMSGVDPKKQALQRKAMRPVMEKFFKRIATGDISWVGTQFPTQADAQEADMSLSDYEDFVYRAGHIYSPDPVRHWKKVYKEQQRLCRILDRVDQLHIRAEGTDLKLRVKGRKWINCAGTENFPDGEIFTGPIENTAEGHIRYSFPVVYMGREVEDVRLEFRKGRVVKESAAKNQKYLTFMLNLDKGARYLGEFAIGTNYEIKRFSKNILFDEKIGGTCHLAVGASIPESGGKNRSGLHWDMVCDLKKGGEITADGKTIYRNGKFTL
ncbi:MAG: aminopeptidase [candidate division Zixibacteria bacterium]|nr:aminopeptidase [candidate division Zixibacteria bacterium]